MTVQDAIQRPDLTLPEGEAALLRAAYARASVILEYGSGGSTLMAAELPGKHVVTIESDEAWADKMRAWFATHPPARDTSVSVQWVDIGETKAWGHPATDEGWRRFARYPLQVWQKPGFRQPDVVLVDGRFRIGCALATAFCTQAPVDLYFDDYAQRDHYHRVEDFLGQPTLTGRMAHFHITPTPIPPAKLLQVVNLMQRP